MSKMHVRKKSREGDNGFLSFLQKGAATCKVAEKNKIRLEAFGKTALVSTRRIVELAAADLIQRVGDRVELTPVGRAYLARQAAESDPFLLQHEGVTSRGRIRNDPIDAVLIDEAESPLAWLAKRRGTGGKPLIDAVQFQAGERLRADFTRAGLTPRVTSNWVAPIAQGKRTNGSSTGSFSDTVLAAKERVAATLEAVGPEFAGLLLDVCCFLKGLETVERERSWPQRTAKVVLGLALDRLARHYGIRTEIRGPSRVPTRHWRAADARPSMNRQGDQAA
jgi:hypothetical protein